MECSCKRFVGEIRRKRADGDVVLHNIMNAARESGRTFAIELRYLGRERREVRADAEGRLGLSGRCRSRSTAHPTRPNKHHKGKPVVSFGAMGLSDGDVPPAPAARRRPRTLIAWFQGKGVTYMGGTPSRWGELTREPALIRRGAKCMPQWTWYNLDRRALRHTRSRRPVEAGCPGARCEAARRRTPSCTCR
jgi:hypothetical protein